MKHFVTGATGFIGGRLVRQLREAGHDVAVQVIKKGLRLVIVQPGLVYRPGDTSSLRGSLIQYLQRSYPLCPNRPHSVGRT